jgi:hypothetical protein
MPYLEIYFDNIFLRQLTLPQPKAMARTTHKISHHADALTMFLVPRKTAFNFLS